MLRRALVLSLLWASAGFAQTQDALIAELEATQRRAADRTASLREREQAADKAMELRARAIDAAAPGDPRLPGWLMDNAAGELARLGRDGSDTAVLLCIPLPAQERSVRRGAEQALQHLERASGVLDARHKALEAAPAADPIKIQVEQDRTVRVPFFASRARVLLAAGALGTERTRHARAAFDEVGKLSLSNPGSESIRKVIVGAALLMRADPPAAADLQTAIDEFGWVLTGGAGGAAQAGASAATRAEAWFGIMAAGAGLGKLESVIEQFRPALAREPFVGPDGRADSLLAVLAADSISRAWVEEAVITRDRTKLDRAVAEQQSLLRRQDLALRPDSLRPLVYQKLHVIGGRAGGLDLPAAMDLAGAIDAAKDPARRDDALQRLRAVAEAPDAGEFAADALWELAVVRTQGSPSAEDRLAAVEALVRLAREFPSSARASEALGAALAHAQSLARQPDMNRAGALYREALQVATTSFPELTGIDTWRYEYGRVLADREDAPIVDLSIALRALRRVPASAAIAPEAGRLLERVQARVLDEAWARVGAARRSGDAESVQALCRAEVLPEARQAVERVAAGNSGMLDRFRADLADALTECGDSGGRAMYDDLLRRKAEVPGGWARVRLGLARSLLISGDTGAAFSTLRDLGTALDAPPAGAPPSARPEPFWHAWTLILEELSARNADGSRTGTIRANIKRLESIDAGFGGEPWRTRITKVRARVG